MPTSTCCAPQGKRGLFDRSMAIRMATILGTVLSGAAASAQSPPAELPHYAVKVRLQRGTPRLSAEATVTLPSPDTGRVAFVLAQMFTLESVQVRDGEVFRPARTDSTVLPGTRPGWGNVRWRIHEESDRRRRGMRLVAVRIRYRLDTAAAALVFGVDDAVTFASGINTAWYPQFEDGSSAIAGRVRTKRGTGTMEFEVPDSVTVYAVGTPSNPAHANARRSVFLVDRPAYFNFAAGRYHVRQSLPSQGAAPPTATYYLTPRDSAASYLTQSVAVLRALTAEFGAYPFSRFALVEIPSGLAERAGFAGASADGAIFTTSEYLDQPFNAAYYGHEIGHQWWGVTIRPLGSRGTWMLSEGMAQYGALRAVEAIAGADGARTFRQREYPGYFGQGGELYFRTVAEGHDAPLADLPAGEEWSRDIADSKGFMALNALANEIGRDRLRAAFREILRDFPERRLSWDDFLAAVQRAAGRDMSWFFEQWFYRTGAPELTAELDVSAGNVVVRQAGEPYRLTLDLAFVGPGCPLRTRVMMTLRDTRVPFPAGCRPDSVLVDPDYEVLRWTPELQRRYPRAKAPQDR